MYVVVECVDEIVDVVFGWFGVVGVGWCGFG